MQIETWKKSKMDNIRETGIGTIGGAPWGTHFCQFYRTKEDLLETLVPYFKAGLEKNEMCVLVTSDFLTKEEIMEHFAKLYPNFFKCLEAGQMEIFPYTDWYLKGGNFDLQRTLNMWLEKYKEALGKGYEGLRISGNPYWIDNKKDWNDFTEYESKIDEAIKDHNILVLCTYSLLKCASDEIIDVVNNHQFAIIKRSGNWELVKSSAQVDAEAEAMRASEKWQRTFDHISDSVFIQDKDFTITRANKATFEMLKLKEDDIIGKKCFEVFHKSGRPWVNCPLEKTRLDKQPHTEEVYDPNIGVALLVTTSPIFDKNGEFTGSVHVAKDITEQKKLELLLEKRANDNQTIIDSVPAMVFYKDKENRFIRINKNFAGAMNMPKEKLEGKSLFEIYPKEQADEYLKDDLEVIGSGKAKRNIIEQMSTPNGTRWVQTDKIPHADENGNVAGVIGFSVDITERKKSEEALTASEVRYRRLFESAKDGILILNAETGSIDDVNPFLTELLGYSRDQLLSKKVWEIGFLKDIAANRENFLQLQEKGYVRYENLPLETADGRRINVEFVSNVYLIDHIKVVQCNIRDITERKKAEEKLIRSEAKYRELADSITDNFTAYDHELRCVFRNKSAQRNVSIPNEQAIGKKFEELHPEMVGSEIHKAYLYGLEEKETVSLQTEWHHPIENNTTYHELTIYPRSDGGIAIISRDITERKKKEEELQKLNRTLLAISNSNQLLMRAADEKIYLNDVCKIITDFCGYKMVWIGFAKDDEEKSVEPVAYSGFEDDYLRTLKITWADKERGRGPTGSAIRDKQVTICHDMLTDPRLAPWREEAIKRGYASSIALPLLDGERALGAVMIYSDKPNPFLPDEINLLRELASDISYGIISLRRQKAKDEAERLLKENEAKLRKEKDTFQVIMQNTKSSLAYLDRDFNFLAANAVFCKNNGRTEEELISKNYFDFFPGEETRLIFEKVRDTGKPLELIQRPLVFKGQPWREITYWDWTISPVENEEDYVYGIIINLVDVSERVKSIENLKIHGQKLEEATSELRKVQTAVENASDIVFITDNKGKIIYINKAVKDILGHRQKELIGKKPNFWMEDMPNKFFGQMWNAIYFNKKPFIGEIQDRKKDGEPFVAEIKIAPVLDKNSQILSFVGIERDITAAKKLDLAKTEFISLAAHQLRTPITTVSLTAEMLLGGLAGKTNKESEGYLNDIIDGIKKMSDMIELFLNVSRIEMGTFEIMPKPINVGQIVEENIKEIMPQLKNKDLDLKKNIPQNLPIINTDARALNIVMENLLVNAIKYTPNKGVINVEVEKFRDSIIIKVSDSGCGIPKDQQKRIFEKLFRADNASEKFEGIGLGLYLSRAIIEQAGGKIWVESVENIGSSFFISLPLNGKNTKNKK